MRKRTRDTKRPLQKELHEKYNKGAASGKVGGVSKVVGEGEERVLWRCGIGECHSSCIFRSARHRGDAFFDKGIIGTLIGEKLFHPDGVAGATHQPAI